MTSITTYLDYNATAPVKPAVLEAVARALEAGGNPSSVHGQGRQARNQVEEARERVAALVGAAPTDVVFTSGGTEANNLCLRALHKRGYRLFVSAVEHPSVMNTAQELDATIVLVDANGRVRADTLDDLLKRKGINENNPALVSVMLANNETGVVQPVQALAQTAHKYGALFHTDAVQAAGKTSIDINEIQADLLTLSGHKIAAAAGIGALVITSATGKMAGIQTGGGQEKGLRPGTENLSGIAGFGVAAELALQDLATREQTRAQRDDLESRLRDAVPDILFFGQDADRVGNTSCFAIPGITSEVQVMGLDLEGIAVSSGAACSSGKVTASPVLLAMGIADDVAASAIRVSLGWATTKEDIDRFVTAWTGLCARLVKNNKELTAA